MTDRSLATRLTVRGALRVPEVTVYFWVIKALSTAMGEATSDYLVHAFPPALAVLMGFAGFLVLIGLQIRARRYNAWTYWGAVVGVGVFGTMCADVLHVGFGVPYFASSILYATALVAVFAGWQKTERTLSIHSVNTPRRELFYWAAVVATFAMGTALGDLTAVTFHLGYFASAWLFAVFIAVPALGFWLLRWNPILSFWWAYVATRPLGASFADWFGKPASSGGLGYGDGTVALVLTLVILGLVAYLAVSRRDVQGLASAGAGHASGGHAGPRSAGAEHAGAGRGGAGRDGAAAEQARTGRGATRGRHSGAHARAHTRGPQPSTQPAPSGYPDPGYRDPRHDDPAYRGAGYATPRNDDPAYRDAGYATPRHNDPAYRDRAYREPARTDTGYSEEGYSGPRRPDPQGPPRSRRHAGEQAPAGPASYRDAPSYPAPASDGGELDWFSAAAERQRTDDPWRRR